MTFLRHIIDVTIIIAIVAGGVCDLVYSMPIDAHLLKHVQRLSYALTAICNKLRELPEPRRVDTHLPFTLKSDHSFLISPSGEPCAEDVKI